MGKVIFRLAMLFVSCLLPLASAVQGSDIVATRVELSPGDGF